MISSSGELPLTQVETSRSILAEGASGRRRILVFVALGRFRGLAVAAARQQFAAPDRGEFHLPGPSLHSQTRISFGLINNLRPLTSPKSGGRTRLTEPAFALSPPGGWLQQATLAPPPGVITPGHAASRG